MQEQAQRLFRCACWLSDATRSLMQRVFFVFQVCAVTTQDAASVVSAGCSGIPSQTTGDSGVQMAM